MMPQLWAKITNESIEGKDGASIVGAFAPTESIAKTGGVLVKREIANGSISAVDGVRHG